MQWLVSDPIKRTGNVFFGENIFQFSDSIFFNSYDSIFEILFEILFSQRLDCPFDSFYK